MSVDRVARFREIEAELWRLRGLRSGLDAKFRGGVLDSFSYARDVGIVGDDLRALLEEERSIFEGKRRELVGALAGLGGDSGRVEEVRGQIRHFDSLLAGVDAEISSLPVAGSVSGGGRITSLFSSELRFVLFVLGVFALFGFLSAFYSTMSISLFNSLLSLVVFLLVLCVSLGVASLVTLWAARLVGVERVSFRLSFVAVSVLFVADVGLGFLWSLFGLVFFPSVIVFLLGLVGFVVSLGLTLWVYGEVFSISWGKAFLVSLASAVIFFGLLVVFYLFLFVVTLLFFR